MDDLLKMRFDKLSRKDKKLVNEVLVAPKEGIVNEPLKEMSRNARKWLADYYSHVFNENYKKALTNPKLRGNIKV